MRDVGQWFVAGTWELCELAPSAPVGEPIGLDFGVANVLTDSLGRLEGNPRGLARAGAHLARPPRTGPLSHNCRKATRKLALRHRTLRRQRRDWLHVLSDHYANSHGMVVVEDLRVRAMSASARGTHEQPAERARQKAGLNPSILDVGRHELRRQLGYKLNVAARH